MFLFNIIGNRISFQTPIKWFMVFYLGLCHLGAIVGIFKINSIFTILELFMFHCMSGLGVTAGLHRLWSHRSYVARTPLRLLLSIFASMANQGSIIHWVRDHRLHHRYADKEYDPHNINRGFFYAHMGWLLLEKSEEIKKQELIDISDLKKDWVVVLNNTLHPWFDLFCCFIIPALYGMWRLNSFIDGFFIFGVLKYVITLHVTWFVNSVAHTYGYRPYNKNINPCESILTTLVSFGEGWHNWHHMYPYDYACSEKGVLSQYNPTKFFIDFCSMLGQVSNRKRHKLKT